MTEGMPPPMMAQEFEPSLRLSLRDATGVDYPIEMNRLLQQTAFFMEKDKRGEHIDQVRRNVEAMIKKSQGMIKILDTIEEQGDWRLQD